MAATIDLGALARPAGRAAEWRWLTAIVIAVVALVEIPYLLAFSQSDKGWIYAGMLWSPHDFAQYASAMRQGATSNGWLIYDQLSHEAHDPAFLYAIYVGLGKITALTGLGFGAVFHIAEILGRVTLVVALYSATGLLFSDIERRRRALLVCLFAGGLGAVMLALGISLDLPLKWPIFLAVDLALPEFSTFLTLFTAPHLAMGLAAMLLWARTIVHSTERVHPGTLAAMGTCVLIVGLSNPFSLVGLVCVGFAYLCVTAVIHRALPTASIVSAAVTGLCASPLLAYNALVFSRDPFWATTYGAQNALPTAPPVTIALAYGALLIFAIIAIPALIGESRQGGVLVLVWISVSIILMYVPVPYQRRFGFGVHPMLALAATAGIEVAVSRLRRATGTPIAWRWRLLRSCVTVALFSSTFTFFLLMTRAAALPSDPKSIEGAFLKSSIQRAAEWFSREAGPTDIVLAETQTANYIVGWFPGRVYSAHWVATANYEEKVRATSWFFRTDDEVAREAFVHQVGVRYIVFGPAERAFGGADPASPAIRPVFEIDGMTIYRVEGPLGAGQPDLNH